MIEDTGRCYILRLKNVVSKAKIVLPITGGNGKTSKTIAPDEPGSYTLFEELDVNMHHVGWVWSKEGVGLKSGLLICDDFKLEEKC